MANSSTDTNPTTGSVFAEDEPTTAVTVDLALFAYRGGVLHVLLVQRGWPPYQGCWALPGGFKEPDEGLDAAAHRELFEETRVNGVTLRQVRAYGDPGRDPRGPVVTVAFTALLNIMPTPVAGDDARAARWTPLIEVLAERDSVAFDHRQIILDSWVSLNAEQHRNTERAGLLAEIERLTDALREADAHLDIMEHERDTALADADRMRAQADEHQPSGETPRGERA